MVLIRKDDRSFRSPDLLKADDIQGMEMLELVEIVIANFACIPFKFQESMRIV